MHYWKSEFILSTTANIWLNIQWLLFSSADEVDAIWKVVARGTVQGDLGIAAKVVPDEGDSSRARVICIYTKNFTDIEDIRRVAKQMKELGLITTRGRPAHYKCGKLCLSL